MAYYTVDSRPSPIDFECSSDKHKRTLQNVKNLISCRMGEVPFDRMRGLNPAIFDLNIEEMNGQLMPEIDRVLGYEPDAEAISAEAVIDSNGDTVIIVVVDVTL